MMPIINALIALSVLREFFWVPNQGPALQRLALAFLVLLLVACGHNRLPDICNTELEPQTITWPDGIVRKSDIARCSSATNGDKHTRVSWVNDPSDYFDVWNSEPEGYLPPSANP